VSAATRSKSSKGRGAARRAAARRQPNPVLRRALRPDLPHYDSRLVLGPANYLLMAIGVAAIVLGFILLALKDITVAPVLLVLGYCILIPAGLLLRGTPWRRGRGQSGGNPGGE
jgi:hypothetical protein